MPRKISSLAASGNRAMGRQAASKTLICRVKAAARSRTEVEAYLSSIQLRRLETIPSEGRNQVNQGVAERFGPDAIGKNVKPRSESEDQRGQKSDRKAVADRTDDIEERKDQKEMLDHDQCTYPGISQWGVADRETRYAMSTPQASDDTAGKNN